MWDMQERRNEVRSMCADMVEAHWRDENGRQRSGTALLEDISASGACLQLENAVPVGVGIQWECPGQQFAGRVRYCTYREIGYFVGVEFSGDVRWSEKAYTPRHMLDLKRLVV